MRDADKRIVRLKEGEPKGRHVVIVDDLVQSGGTLIECQKLLASQVGGGPRADGCLPAVGLDFSSLAAASTAWCAHSPAQSLSHKISLGRMQLAACY